jgi:O-antigen ligase
MLLTLFIEAGVVGVICVIFLILFVVAGIRQTMKEQD